MWDKLLAPLMGVINKVIDKVVPDKQEAMRLQQQVFNEVMTTYRAEMENATKIVLAEAQGESWMQRNWRPVLMLSVVGIIVNNYILLPWLAVFGFAAPLLALPAELWSLLTIGVGGYVIGRSAEKVAETVAPNLTGKK